MTIDPISAWLEACADRTLVIQHCTMCGRFQHYPREFCIHCRGHSLEFVEAEGSGSVESFSIVERSPDPDRFPPPYTVALVRLAEGPVVFTRLVGIEQPECGMAVTVDWWEGAGGALPVFTSA